METPIIITIVGPESSGKTTLARELATAIGCSWVPEHAREFLIQLQRPYTLEDLEILAQEQWQRISDAYAALQALSHESMDHFRQLCMRGNQAFSKNDLVQSLKQHSECCLVVDSGMLTLQQWAWIRFGRKISIVESALAGDHTSLYLLTRAQPVWEFDPLREAPDLLDRVWIYNQYVKALVASGIPFYTVGVDTAQVSTD